MSHRSYLKKSISLFGESNGKLFERTFSIVRVISEGADGICYEAFHKTSGKGVLKEYYPDRYVYLLERNRKGQLGISDEFTAAAEDFIVVRNRFLDPYNMLLDIRQSSNDRDISSFVPHFEIYYGSSTETDPGFEGTVYIWTPEPELETFDKICRDIRRHPDRRPEYMLVTVLSAVQSLAKCVCVLHSAGIIHRDIKPSNFGFVRRGGETLTQTLSMFDIDSLCSVWDESPETIVTEGYTEPEAGYKECSNQTDIYSIGATLFTAIVITDETRAAGNIYREGYYDRLNEMVAESELISASEANSHPRLRNILAGILRKCLCGRKQRYQNCEALIEDLSEALFYALPPEVARKSRRGEKWILSEVEKSLDVRRENNSSLALMYTLYEHPLYRHLRSDETTLNVLIAGFRNYGQKFIDACLQIGQMRGAELDITVVTDDDTDREIYLSERPALRDFFSIDGEQVQDACGNITFVTAESAGGIITQQDINAAIEKAAGGRHIHYAFIALGDDATNHRAAVFCRKLFRAAKDRSTVCYASESEERKRRADADELIPVCVSSRIGHSQRSRELERMAFNTHLVWERSLNLNYQTIRKEFRKRYNYDSCISSVIALKYKLISLGIDLDRLTPDEAARCYRERLSADNTESRQIKDELVWIEHRRWVAEKICKGWTCQTDLEPCMSGQTRDEKSKKHICLLRSRPDQLLQELFADNDRTWDQITPQEYGSLDDLDRMSVRLHRLYVRKADAVKRSNLLRNTLLSGIRTVTEGNAESLRAFNEWYSCINSIWNGDRTKLRLYRSRKEQLAETAKLFGAETGKALIQQIIAFDKYFHPVLAAMEYKDWKQEDTAFIDNMPFILTYSGKVTLLIPYNAGPEAEKVFSNVASASMISPERIIYLYQADKPGDIGKLMKTLPSVLFYMDRRRLKASVDFVIGSETAENGDRIRREIIELGHGRIRSTEIIKGQLSADPAELYKMLPSSARRSVTAAERNSTPLSGQLEVCGFYDRFAWYEFDTAGRTFRTSPECDMFGYIRKDPFITVRDLELFDRALSVSREKPEFFGDHEKLWKKYSEDPETWRRLCRQLRAYSDVHDCAAEFRKGAVKEPETYRYVIPAFCWFGATEAVSQLRKRGFLSEGTVSAGLMTDSCIAELTDHYGLRQEYDRLFSNVYALADSSSLSFIDTEEGTLRICFDDLITDRMTPDPDTSGKVAGLLEYLNDNGYLIALRNDSSGISFTYASRQIKKLLTSGSRIVEIYTYHRARNMDVYDDVSLGTLHIKKAAGIPCCLMTKGFSGTIVLFDDRVRPETAAAYGINCTALSAEAFTEADA